MKKELENLIGFEVKEDVLMKDHTYFKIGGPAKFFVVVNNKVDLLKAVNAAKKLDLKYFILGGGSNILVADKGFDGLVIKMVNGEVEIKETMVSVFAGNNLGALIKECLEKNLCGLEFAANIPGTIGGAIRGNAGAYGQGVGDFVENVEVLVKNEEEVTLKVLTKEECQFEYRESIFKKQEDWVISQINLKLDKCEDPQKNFEQIKEEYATRCSKQPYEYPSAGCSFKNVILNEDNKKYEDWAVHGKIPAAKLIEEADLKGMKIGGAMVSDKHANFIINIGNAKADDVVQLISLVKMRIRDDFGIQLVEEVQYVGF